MEITKAFKFKRSEDTGNRSCSYAVGKVSDDILDKTAFVLLHDALDDVVTGLLDLLGIEYPQSGAVGEYVTLLGKYLPLPFAVTGIPIPEYNAILCGPFYQWNWNQLRTAHKQLIFLAASCGNTGHEMANGGSGRAVRELLHLLDWYPDSDILMALDVNCYQNKHLAPLYKWSDTDKERARNLLRDRERIRREAVSNGLCHV